MTAPDKIKTSQCGKQIVQSGMREWSSDVEYTRSDLIPDIEAAAEARGREKGIRKAQNAALLSAWKHDGDDAFSKGMDAGARHQVKASIEAIAALLDTPTPDQPSVQSWRDVCRESNGPDVCDTEDACDRCKRIAAALAGEDRSDD